MSENTNAVLSNEMSGIDTCCPCLCGLLYRRITQRSVQADCMEIELSIHTVKMQNANISHITGYIIDMVAINMLIYN